LGAAGSIEVVFTVRALIDQRLPATLGFEEYDDECLIIPTQKTIELNAKTGISHSLAFGGNNSVLILRRA
jgi:3-oxoacyl-(acyl-carrier-protein) synthase